MSGISFARPDLIHLVWLALAVTAILGWLDLRGRDALGRFLSASMQARLALRPTVGRRVARLALILATLVLGAIALMRPQSRGADDSVRARRVQADRMVVLDVSKSMLAEDAAPNRLARAKAEVSELVDQLAGHRVGLVAFAGRAALLCPLTPDYGFFRMVLRDVDTSSVGRGGTRIGEAIRKGIEGFGPGSGARLMLLVTDGEDHDSFPEDAAKEAAAAGVRLIGIGFGSEDGSEITITDPQTGARSQLIDSDGRVVRSRLDGALLREIALVTEGVYVPAGTAALDLESIVEQYVEPLVQETESMARKVTVEHYQGVVLGCLVALFASVWVGSGGARRRER